MRLNDKKTVLVIALFALLSVALTIKLTQFYGTLKVQEEFKGKPPIVVVDRESNQQQYNVTTPFSTEKSRVTETEVAIETDDISSSNANENIAEFSENPILWNRLAPFSDESIPTAILDRNSIVGALHSYFKKFNEYPQGSNAEIMRVLDKKYLLSHYSRERLNKTHEFPDTWGTAYEIRISPDGEIQLISAGSNKIFGDDDDKML